MKDDDAFGSLLLAQQALSRRGQRAQAQALGRAGLEQLQAYLDNPQRKPAQLWNTMLANSFNLALFAPGDVALAALLHARLLEVGGTMVTTVEAVLIRGVALALAPSSVSFFQSLLAMSRPRDKFAIKRRELALAALAVLAAERSSAEALALLEQAASDERPDVQGAAASLLLRAFAETRRPVPEAALAAATRVAREGRGTLPRYQARLALANAGIEPPMDVPDGTYTFEITVAPGVSRTIELRSGDTLGSLCGAVLDAIGWDHDHLFVFYLTGNVSDGRFTWPQDDDVGAGRLNSLFTLLDPTSNAPAAVHDDALTLDQLGQLGLVKGHVLLLRYDFGDDHRFKVKVKAVSDKADPKARYPRVVGKKGRAPRQYGNW